MRSFEIAIAVFFIGATFLIAAFAIGILNFETCWQGTPDSLVTYRLVACSAPHVLAKQVGFGLALNWSVGLCILLPMFVYCVCETISGGMSAIEEMVARHMIVDDKWKTPSVAFMKKMVRKRTVSLIVVVAAVAMLATVTVALEYYRVVGRFYGEAPFVPFSFTDPQNEADWSIAAPICQYTGEASEQCNTVRQYSGLNGWFAGFAYGYLVYLGSISAISFMFAFGLYVRFVFSSDMRKAKLRVVPDLRSGDPRRGFEVLEDFFVYSIAGCFVLFAMGYLVTLQNVYLRQPAENLAAFFVPLIPATSGLDIGRLVGTLQAGVKFIIVNPNTVAVTFLGMLFFAIVIASAASALGRAARRGTNQMQDELKLATPAPNFLAHLAKASMTPDEAKTALEDVKFWPMRWPSVNTTMACLILGIIALLFVSVGAVIVAAALAIVLKEAGFRPKQA